MAKKDNETAAPEGYEEILNRSWDDIPEELLLPVGSWLLTGRNASFLPAREEGKNPRVLFFYTPKEPMDDVDQDALAEIGYPDNYDISENQIVKTIWIEGNRDWRQVKAHLEMHGVDTSAGSIMESLKAFRGTEVVAYLDQRQFTRANGEEQFENSPTNFSPIE